MRDVPAAVAFPGFKLTINGEEPLLLSSDRIEYFSAAFFMRNPLVGGLRPDELSIRRERFVGDGMQDRIVVTNQSMRSIELTLITRLRVAIAIKRFGRLKRSTGKVTT